MKRILALALVLLLCISFSGCQKEDTLTAEYAVYMGGGVNDGEIYYTDFRSEPFQITQNFSTTMCYGNEGYTLSKRTTIHGDKIFYYDDAATFQSFGGGSMYKGTLYYRSLANRKSAPVKIDTDVSGFELSAAGDTVTYLKYENEKAALYQHNLAESTLISSSVSAAYPNKDSGSITYLTEGEELYVYENGSSTKIADGVKTLKAYGENKATLCYYSGGMLYILKGTQSTAVDADVALVEQVYSSGECYYLKKSPKQLVLMDFVEDSGTNSTLRSALKATNHSTLFYYTLYYFNGSETVALADNVVLTSIGAITADSSAVIAFTTYTLDETDKILISEIESISAAQDAIKTIITEATEKHVAVKEKMYSLPTATVDYAVAPLGDTVYCYADKTDTYKLSDVYVVVVNSDGIGEPELYEKQITDSLFFEEAGQVGYYKGGALYFDKIKIADNVYNYSLNSETGGISIMQNYDEENKLGTVCHMMDGRAEVLSTSAGQHIMLKDRVVYIKNSNTLYLHIEGEEREIAKAARILLAK